MKKSIVAVFALLLLFVVPANAASLAEVLGWKFNHAPGIRTMGSPSGAVIFDWPPALGPEPTAAQIAQWTAEYVARPIENPEMSAEDLWEVLRAKGIVGDADVPPDRRLPPRQP